MKISKGERIRLVLLPLLAALPWAAALAWGIGRIGPMAEKVINAVIKLAVMS